MDAPVEIAISSSWGHALAIALAPLMWWAASRYGPVKQAFTRTLTAWDSPFLTKCIRTLGVTAVGVAVIVAAAYLFVIGWDRLFDRVIIGQALTLDYPWPRQDAILSWDDRVQVEFQTKNLGLRRFVRLRPRRAHRGRRRSIRPRRIPCCNTRRRGGCVFCP